LKNNWRNAFYFLEKHSSDTIVMTAVVEC